jgi:hypothetical protein
MASSFSECDGFGLPSSGGDGMTSYAMVLGIFNPPGYGTTAKSSTDMGNAGVNACDAALADGKLEARFWMRKVSLLRARALHNLERGDAKQALEDLDRAKAAVVDASDPFYARSLGLGVDLVRAYALRETGDQAGASSLALKALNARPYNRQTSYSALIAIGASADDPSVEAAIMGLARFNPQVVDWLYAKRINQGRWADAAPLYRQLAPPKSRKHIKTGAASGHDVDYVDHLKAEMFWIQSGGFYAYAVAAQGKAAEARQALAAVKSRFAKALEVPPEPPGMTPEQANERLALENANVTLQKSGTALVAELGRLVELRALVDEGQTDKVLADIKLGSLPRARVSVDLLDALAAKLPTGSADWTMVAKLKTSIVLAPSRPFVEPSVSALFKALPDAETSKRVTPYKQARFSAWTGRADGFTVTRMTRTDLGPDPASEEVVSIKFEGLRSSPSMVEETALLRACDIARQEGKTGLVIVDRNDIQHTLNTTMGYGGGVVRSDPSGFETTLEVVLVDAKNPPEKYRDAAWRIIDVDAAYAALAPIYLGKANAS